MAEDLTNAQAVWLCTSVDLVDSGAAVPFEVQYAGRSENAFAVRFDGEVHAYLNRCAHVPMEMDYQPNQFFDDSGQWLICATHGALYCPRTGTCMGGPCRGRGALVKIRVSEHGGAVHWHTDALVHSPF